MLISEIFHSIQGEGELTGVPSVFIRTSGCNLRCNWCDTMYASWEPEGSQMSLDEVLQKVHSFPAQHCVLTGGEPMVAKQIHALAAALKERGTHITIETAATVPPAGHEKGGAALDSTATVVASPYHTGSLGAGSNYSASAAYTVPVCANGPIYFFVKADSFNYVNEFAIGYDAETNNVTSAPLPTTVIPAPRPDLRVAGITAPALAQGGNSLLVTLTVTNANLTPAGIDAWTDRIYVSPSATPMPASAAATYDVQHVEGLAGATGYSASATVTLPDSLAGDYFILVQADAGGAIGECSYASNNVSSAPLVTHVAPIAHPDLEVASLLGPAAAQSGDFITPTWAVTNLGPGAVPAISWQDTLYLSTDPSNFVNAVTLGSVAHSGGLGVGAGYVAGLTVQLPWHLSGPVYLGVCADSGNTVNEGANEGNNCRRTPLPLVVTQVPLADLVVTNMVVPASGIAGQTITVSWLVLNSGSGPTSASAWSDYVYLSADMVLDATDPVVAWSQHQGTLAPGQRYTNTVSFQLPLGAAGPYYVFVSTDVHSAVLELDKNNNSVAASVPVQVALPAWSDLAVGGVTMLQAAMPGQPARFSWVVTNLGPSDAVGQWEDAVYLSNDPVWDVNDALLGKVPHSGGLPAGQSYAANLTAVVPGVVPGPYYVIVRADIRNQLREANDQNNTGVSAPVTILDVTELQLGQLFAAALTQGTQQYYKVRVPSNEVLRITLTSQDSSSLNELFLRYGLMPNRADFDFQYGSPFQANQQITVPQTQDGYYYILVNGQYVPHPPANYKLQAQLVPFGITSVSPTHIGDNGQVTITINGALFTNGVLASLISGTNTLSATKMTVVDSATMKARFQFTNVWNGTYDLKVASARGDVATLPAGIVIEPATSLSVTTSGSADMFPRNGGIFRWNGSVQNAGNTDVPYLTLVVLVNESLQLSVQPPTDGLPAITNALGGPVFTLRDLEAGGNRYFAFQVEGYAGPFEYAISSTPRLQSDYIANLQTTVETAREAFLDLATNGLSPELAGVIVDPDAWWTFVRSGYESLGLLDAGAGATRGMLRTPNIRTPNITGAECKERVRNEIKAGLAAATAQLGVCLLATRGNIWGIDICLAKYSIDIAKLDSDLYHKLCYCDKDYNVPCGIEQLVCNFLIGYPRPKHATDPNTKQGPTAYGAQRYVGVKRLWPYTIDFENLPSANATARGVAVTDRLDNDLDIRSVRLTEIDFGYVKIPVPPNRSFFQSRVLLSTNLGALVADIFAGVDVETRQIRCILSAIDPATGQPPENANLGLLSPNDSAHRGEGHIAFTVMPRIGIPTGTVITNQAAIIFDNNEPIATAPVWNTIDAVAPTSAIAALPRYSPQAFPVAWGAADDPGGSGVASVDVYVTTDGTNASVWLQGVAPAGSATFTGDPGHTYAFYSTARDNVANVETPHVFADASTTVVLDRNSPVVSISIGPPSGARVTESTLHFGGDATDDIGVTSVEWQLSNANGTSAWSPAVGTSSWAVTLTNLAVGENTVRVRARDLVGNFSSQVSRSFVLLTPLTVSISGCGTVQPDYRGTTFKEAGVTYTITATPCAGYAFTNWTGGVAANTATLSFIMQPGLALQANFAQQPYNPVKATYNGLFYETNGVAQHSSGAFTLATTAKGKFTGSLQLGGARYPMSGQFNTNGYAHAAAGQRSTGLLTMDLQMDTASGAERIVGTVGGSGWVAELAGDRAYYDGKGLCLKKFGISGANLSNCPTIAPPPKRA